MILTIMDGPLDDQTEEPKDAAPDGHAARLSADQALVQMLAEMDDEYGSPTAEHYAWADRVLGVST